MFEADEWDLPEVVTMRVMEGVEAYDPELGGTPLEMPDVDEIPGPFELRLVDTRTPPKKKAKGKKKAAEEGHEEEGVGIAAGAATPGRGSRAARGNRRGRPRTGVVVIPSRCWGQARARPIVRPHGAR